MKLAAALLWLRRATGALLVVCATLPVYRLLAGRETGLAGAYTTQFADVFSSFLWMGTLVVVLCGLLATRLVPLRAAESAASAIGRVLTRPRPGAFALTIGTIAFTFSLAFALLALDGRPNQIDAISQLLHAHFLAQGRLAGPADVDYAFWQIQNSVVTDRGWVSQYPPGHVVFLALGVLANAPWIVGPVMVGLTVAFTALLADRLLPDRIGLARAGSLLVALSTFLICLGGSFMNHASAAALLAAAAWAAARAWQDAPRWAFAAGAAAGYAFTIRPLTALAVGGGVIGALWLRDLGTREGRVRSAGLFARAAAGALPFVTALAAYNTWFFGSPTTFGYNVALGPTMGLGFGRDPWGNVYGPIEAIGYTAADLLTLGSALLETPLSIVLPVGVLLALARRLDGAERVFAGWALVPVAANVLYWHHGMYMGPRMLFETAPAWILLGTLALARLWYALPARFETGALRLSPRAGLAGALACALSLGILWLGPQRARGYATPAESVAGVAAPDPGEPSLIFVHDGWTARIAMQLAGARMRLDSVETALRQNPTCDVQALVDAVVAGDAAARDRIAAHLDFEPRATDLPPVVQIATGNMMRIRPGTDLAPDCRRQAMADRFGILDVAPLLWLGDLSGGPTTGPMYVRDLGPERNARLIAKHPDRAPYLFFTPGDLEPPVLRPYDEALALLWSHDARTVAAAEEGP